MLGAGVGQGVGLGAVAAPNPPSPPAKGFGEFSNYSPSAAHLAGAENSVLPPLLSKVLLPTPC